MNLVAGFLVVMMLISCQSALDNHPELPPIEFSSNFTQQVTPINLTRTWENIPTSTATSGSTEDIKSTPDDTINATISPTITKSLLVNPTIILTSTPSRPTRFAVIGDYGLAGEPESDVADLVKNWNPDFIITTGDNNYPNGGNETIDENIGQYYHAYIYPYIGGYGNGAVFNRFFPTLGNHDWNTDQANPYLEYFSLPGNERYYDFVWGPIHLFAIDSDSREPDGVGQSSTQGQWLQDRLINSESVWKIVYMHHPPYSSSGEEGSITWIQWPFKEWGATAVIAGHSHVYERVIVDNFPYFVNGLGGGPRYSFNAPLPGSEVRFRSDYGAMLVEATESRITFQFITREHKIIDIYEIMKNN
jgi:hypothetical protein